MHPISLWKNLTAAPHRVMFFGGVLQAAFAVLWWLLALSARYGFVTEPSSPVFTTWLHAWLMLFGVFPFFMFGFLMTTYPRWMIGPLVPSRAYVGAFVLLFAGDVGFYAGLLGGGTAALIAGVTLHLGGMAYGAYALYSVYRAVGPARNRRYETHINMAWGLGILSEFAYLAWLLTGEPLLLQAAMRGGLWLFLVPILVLVGHRMIPFFSSGVLTDYRIVQPSWTFTLVWFAVVAHFVLETTGSLEWLFLADLPLLFVALHHTLHWEFLRSLSVRLLGALHIAFACLSLGLVLSVAQSLWLSYAGEVILGRGPLHAIGIGFVGGMVIAMVTRVSRGHSGRPLVMDALDWYAFLGVLFAGGLRVIGDVDLIATLSPVPLHLVAAVVWLASVVPWAMRYLLIYSTPRIDGKPG